MRLEVGLHEELELMVASGLPPMAVLQSATRNAAMAAGLVDRERTIEVGKNANLVLVDADPLADIRNTRRISAVVLNGRHLDRRTLDDLFTGSEGREVTDQAAAEPPRP